jgi:hypothetical protein
MLLAAGVVLFVALLLAADRAVKVVKRGRRRRHAGAWRAATAAHAEAEDRQRRAAAEASVALTSLMPTIHDHDTRHVD